MGAGAAHRTGPSRSLGALLNDLTNSSTQLVRDEIRLAKTETAESLVALRRGAVLMGVGIGIALFACGAAVASLIMVLSAYVVGGLTWLAALIVAIVLGVIAALCVWRGRAAIPEPGLALRETTTSIEDTASWLKHPAKSAVR
ncbi:MAG: phage holin family protein [Gemmatimonadaceae bacterium]